MDSTTLRVISKIREELLNQAEAAVRFPKKDSFDHGVQVGNWQGLDQALQIIDSVLKDNEDSDSRL